MWQNPQNPSFGVKSFQREGSKRNVKKKKIVPLAGLAPWKFDAFCESTSTKKKKGGGGTGIKKSRPTERKKKRSQDGAW